MTPKAPARSAGEVRDLTELDVFRLLINKDDMEREDY